MEFNKETPTQPVTIQSTSFSVPKPFAEGHVCTASESGVLNQTLAENTRNNWNERVKKGLETATEKEPFDHVKMQAEIDEYLESYDFGVRRGRGPTDPVEREALNIGKDIVKRALREKNFKVADIDASEITRLAEEVVAKNPDITKEAKRRVEQRNKLTVGDLDIGSIAA